MSIIRIKIWEDETVSIDEFLKGDPLVSLDFFENPMAHPRMKVQVLGSSKLPLAKKISGEKSVCKHDLFL